MKILPVYPEFPASFWSFKYAVKMLGKKSAMPPLGLATVLAMVPEEGFEIERIVDLNARRLSDRQIKNCDVVFTSSMLVQQGSLDEVIDRAHFFGKKVVAGGPYPTSYGEKTKADHLVLGEAELSFPEFLRDLKNGGARRVYGEEDGKRLLQIDLTKEGKPQLNRTPIPRWDLLNLKDYASLAVQYSRGCPHDCEFCDIVHLYGKIPRTKSVEQMLKEFDAVYNAGWRGALFVVDDNFIGNKPEVRKLLPELEKWQGQHGYPFSLFTEVGMDLALPENRVILEGMVDSGFESVFSGIESIDLDVLKGMNKSQNMAKATPLEKVRTIQKAGLKVQAGFIIGSDGEKPEVFDNLFNFIQEAGIVMPMPGLLGALKGTKLYDRLEREGRLRNVGSGDNTHGLEFNFQPEMDEEFLLNGYTELLKKLFDPKNYYERCRVEDSVLGKHKTQSRMTLASLRALVNVSYENLIRNPNKEFVKYVYETTLRNPREFPEAITNAVKLHHFRTITNATVSISSYRTRVEELYGRFMEGVEGLRGSAEEKYKQFKKIQRGIEKKASRMFKEIPGEFRDNAVDYLNGLRQRINDLGQNYFGSLAYK